MVSLSGKKLMNAVVMTTIGLFGVLAVRKFFPDFWTKIPILGEL